MLFPELNTAPQNRGPCNSKFLKNPNFHTAKTAESPLPKFQGGVSTVSAYRKWAFFVIFESGYRAVRWGFLSHTRHQILEYYTMQHQPQRYVAYYRVSTQKQGQSGLGPEGQKKAVADFLQQYGGDIISEFVEVESGKRPDRPEFTKAADYAEIANATLLVTKLDRLRRDLHFEPIFEYFLHYQGL